MRLHGIDIPVTDIDRAFRFYADALEFPVVGRFGPETAIFFLGDVHGGMVNLVRSATPSSGGGPCLVLSAEGDIEAAKARLEAKGVRFTGGIDHSPLGLTAPFLDSEGNRLALFDSSMAVRLREQAKASNADLLDRLAQREASLGAALEGLAEADATRRPAPVEWPILGHLAHIVDTLDSCGVVSHDLASGRQPPRDRLLETDYAFESLAASRGELTRAFEDAREWLAGLPEAGHAPSTLVHGVFGELDARAWVAFMLFHVGMHTDQVGTIRKQLAEL